MSKIIKEYLDTFEQDPTIKGLYLLDGNYFIYEYPEPIKIRRFSKTNIKYTLYASDEFLTEKEFEQYIKLKAFW